MRNLLLADLKISEVREPPGHQPGAGVPRRWTSEELLALLDTDGNKALAKKLERSEMSIQMKRGEFVMNFFAWLERKGYELPATVAQVDEYFEDRSGAAHG